MATRKVRTSLTLSSDVLEAIDRLAVGAKVSRSAFIEAVLRQYLSDQTEIRSPSLDARDANWIGSMKDTMEIVGDIVSTPNDEND
jgi:metal-responsive CopG/Arc/MetJ family transcriptional regulator